MDPLTLAERLRGIIGGAATPRDGAHARPDAARIAEVLGGEWRERDGHRCLVVERRLAPDEPYGWTTVGALAAQLRAGSDHAPAVGAGARAPFLFFDLETTGLGGGAGTHAFLIGCGAFDEAGAFVTRQYVLARHADERPLLATFASELDRAGALISFNGKSFDAPVLETRYLFHRMEWRGAARPHIDVRHPARRFWREDEGIGCSLGALETQVLGARRVGDVPGFEIPARYFEFLRSGDAQPLAAVLEHNRLDLVSLAGLTARLLHLLANGPDEARDAREALALGRLYERTGLHDRARDAYAKAAGDRPWPSTATSGALRVNALRALAIALRRARRFDEAAACWRRLLELRGCSRATVREATEALAIHHEHRARDLAAAKTFALRSLEGGSDPAWADAVKHRLARIERKMAGATGHRGATLLD